MTHVPTSEQEEAVASFTNGGHLKINAFAGTGKTSTLELLGHSTARRGLYLAFNKAIAIEAKNRFPQTVACQTTHSLAYRSTPEALRSNSNKMTGRAFGNQIAQALGLREISLPAEKTVIRANALGYLVGEAVRLFTQSADESVSDKHVPLIGKLEGLSPSASAHVVSTVSKHAKVLWDRMVSPSDAMPLGHDGYLKLWSLSRPRLTIDFILLDEAQDTNPAVLDVLSRQTCQVVYVGDRHQQIYEWRGAVNAMERIATPSTTYLTRSFRFGPEIAEAASRVLSVLKEVHPLQGNVERRSFVGCSNPFVILCRTNASVLQTVFSAQKDGRDVHVVGGTKDLLRLLEAVPRLKAQQLSDLPEFFGFSSWAQVQAFSQTREGSHLYRFVSMVDSYGEAALVDALCRTVGHEAEADLVVSTAHKAKGCEWDTVRLANDFLKPQIDENGKPLPLDDSEYRLLYVAMTRARTAIDISEEYCEALGIRRDPLIERAASVSPVDRRHRDDTNMLPASRPSESAGVPATPVREDRSQPVPTTSDESGGSSVTVTAVVLVLVALIVALALAS